MAAGLEQWSVGVMEYFTIGRSITPLIHYSNTPLSYLIKPQCRLNGQ